MWKNLRKKISEIHVQPRVNTPFIQPVESILCDCTDCKVENSMLFETLPFEDGHWTSCTVHRCKDCGRMGGFPIENLISAIEYGTPETRQILRDVGIPVDEVIASLGKKERTDMQLNPSRRDDE